MASVAKPKPGQSPKAAWANRLMWAHTNAIENLAVFAPLAIMVHLLGISSTATQLAAAVYFFTRLAHVLIYSAGVPLLRTITFVIGFVAQMTLAIAIL